MYITVKTISDYGDISTAVKVYYDYEVARTNLVMQRDILSLEIILKYAKGKLRLDDPSISINNFGTLTFEGDVLEFIDTNGDYIVRYEIKSPENHKSNYDSLDISLSFGNSSSL